MKTKFKLISTLILVGTLSACATASNTQSMAPQTIAESTKTTAISEKTKMAENTAHNSAKICKTVFKREPIKNTKSCKTADEWRKFYREKREDQFGNGVLLPKYQPDM